MQPEVKGQNPADFPYSLFCLSQSLDYNCLRRFAIGKKTTADIETMHTSLNKVQKWDCGKNEKNTLQHMKHKIIIKCAANRKVMKKKTDANKKKHTSTRKKKVFKPVMTTEARNMFFCNLLILEFKSYPYLLLFCHQSRKRIVIVIKL